MRKMMVAGNWKMNKTVAEGESLVKDLIPLIKDVKNVDRVLCPPFTTLYMVSKLIEKTGIECGAQNMYFEEKGAFTGEVAPSMVAELAKYVILGHSERRGYFGETDESVNKKLLAALAHGLTPIVCVGESLEQNKAGETKSFITSQIHAGFAGLEEDQAASIVIAYEPIWAIGTGLTATSEQAESVIKDIRATYSKMYGKKAGEAVRILYGGSCKASNAPEIFSQPDIDGGLIGGASLKAPDFKGIVDAAAAIQK